METTSSPQPPPPAPPATTTTITNHDHLPDHVIQPNGVLKRHKPRHHHQHQQHNPIIVTYKECLKNHAASMGGHAVDGCGEFMPSPTSVPTDPTSLKCAACGCHRNFHRREPDEVSFFSNTTLQLEYQPHHRHHPPPPPPPLPLTIAPPPPPPPENTSTSPAESPSPPPISSSYYPSAPHMLLALSTPGGAGVTGGAVSVSAPPHHMENPNPNSKKRFRTKFTQDQKQKMHELAERVGWKMQKKDEDLILGFCNQIGVDKGVFKVWMHNNKMTLGNIRKDTVTSHTENHNGSSGGIGIGIDFLSQRDNNNNISNNNQLFQHQHQQQQNNNDSVSSGGGNVIGTNGSSSSS